MWAGAQFGDNNGGREAARQRAYIEFILKLAGAMPLNGYTWLHGVRAGRMVHVGAVDAPVSVGDVTQIAAEFKRAIGTGKDAPKTNGVEVLGWDFAFELNEVAKQQAAAANIQMRFQRIPRDVMDKRAVGWLPGRACCPCVCDRSATRYGTQAGNEALGYPTQKSEALLQRILNASSNDDDLVLDCFAGSGTTAAVAEKLHRRWIVCDLSRFSFIRPASAFSRTSKSNHTYADPGEYAVVIKVIDILGNDTTKTIKVKVA